MQNTNQSIQEGSGIQTAVFGGGCFWCTEAVFTAMKGVLSVQSGYCGGSVQNPTYEQVCGKETGHIEVVKIEFDPQQTDFSALLEVFFATHDPTTPGRQGNDVGPQYQSAVFYQDAAQQETVEQYVKHLETSGAYDAPVCTELHAAAKFWPAEQYHADYFALHPEQGYCQFVIAPKVQKFRKQFSAKLKG
jgi:peptide-methionine (S)-S-oxide reductase